MKINQKLNIELISLVGGHKSQIDLNDPKKEAQFSCTKACRQQLTEVFYTEKEGGC